MKKFLGVVTALALSVSIVPVSAFASTESNASNLAVVQASGGSITITKNKNFIVPKYKRVVLVPYNITTNGHTTVEGLYGNNLYVVFKGTDGEVKYPLPNTRTGRVNLTSIGELPGGVYTVFIENKSGTDQQVIGNFAWD
ncbi:hypothetical protein J5TS2_41300 [Brevibacillus halotolerans]|uniref:hypothetical protein n=1 Tax=Brevibacillus halotolerans TaxID=1507437 RepID=UPI001B04DDF8|nr:hypothetical protein [Brevibacillus halotolerans]GIO03462.1 hypothetical protein J5TS2_41300 [Brevibacillus halotolerans]